MKAIGRHLAAKEKYMRRICRLLAEFVWRQDGPTAVEYAVLLALIIVLCIAAITILGSKTNVTFSKVGSSIVRNTG